MSGGDYAVGLIASAIALSSLAVGALGLRAVLAPGWRGAPARLAEAVLGLSGLLVVSELLGILGILERLPIVLGCVAMGVAGQLARRAVDAGPAARVPPAPRSSASTRAALGAALVATALVTAQWTAFTLDSTHRGMSHVDSLWYHMPFAARYVQARSITGIHQTLTEPLSTHDPPPLGTAKATFGVPTYYPANSSLLHADAMSVFGSDFPSPFLNLGWLWLALAAAWCLGAPWGVGAEAVLGTCIVAGTDAMVLSQPGEALNDIVVTALVLAAAALFVAVRQRGGSLVLVGLAAGLAAGTKLTALVPMAVIAIAALFGGQRGSQPGFRARNAISFAVAMLATGGFWYVRNLVATGNPLPYLTALGPLRLPHPDLPLTDAYSYSMARYVTDGHIWAHVFVPGLRDSFGPTWFIVFTLALAGIVVALVRPPANPVRVIALAAAASFAAHLVTPLTGGGAPGEPVLFLYTIRYLAPALAAGLALLAIATSGAWRRALLPLFALTFVSVEWHRRWPYTGFHRQGIIAALLVLVLAASVTAIRRRGARREIVAVAICVVAAGLVVFGWREAKTYADAYTSPAAPPATAFRWGRTVQGARIGVAGFFSQYPLYGRGDKNWVQYVGRTTPDEGFFPAATCAEWRRLVDAGHYDYVVVGPYKAQVSLAIPSNAAFPTPHEATWTRSSPRAKEIVRGRDNVSVFRLQGPLGTAGCAQ